MKKIVVTILLILLTISVFSQELEIRKISKNGYEFTHDINRGISFYGGRIEGQFDEIGSVEITNNTVTILFKGGTKKRDVLRVLSEVSLIFNHKKYVLI
jgi:hypothetical protein